jgi:hypothetical protein
MPTPKAQVIKLSKEEQLELEKLVSKYQTGQQMALRARIILAALVTVAEHNALYWRDEVFCPKNLVHN